MLDVFFFNATVVKIEVEIWNGSGQDTSFAEQMVMDADRVPEDAALTASPRWTDDLLGLWGVDGCETHGTYGGLCPVSSRRLSADKNMMIKLD